ncbi:MAG TPA: 3-oxoacid CoA-transferase subunit A [Candidatus Eisenbacteria bacterium]|nr:3-oxoacid CoA-transferase subunit A [Candidatus Eisenbacteria bacterium]
MATKRVCETALEAVADVKDGDTLLVHSFGPPQAWPTDCLLALQEHGVKDLTVVCNSTAAGPTSLQILAEKRQVRKLICTFAVLPVGPTPFSEQIRAGEVELELTPQGTMVERVRAGGAGLAGFYTPVGVGTVVEEGKEVREFDGRPHLFERAIRADFALLAAQQADPIGNLTYRRGARNFGPAFATGARTTIAEVRELVPLGAIDPEAVHTPGIFVDRMVKTTQRWDPAIVRQIVMMAGRTRSMEGQTAREGATGLPPDLMAMRVAALLRPGEYVNLGLGLPTLVSNFIEGRGLTLHSENGILGFGAFPPEGEEDIDLYNASGQLVTPVAGTAYFDSTVSFAMARTGRVSTVVLGGFQVAPNGDLANWNVPATGVGGIGGAMDLAAGVAAGGGRLIVIMYHREKSGASKLVPALSYPATARGCVTDIVTDLAYLQVTPEGFLLREIAPGLSVDDVKAASGAPLRVARDVAEMQFA